MKTSTVKSIFFVALIAKDNAAGQAIVPADCFIGLQKLAFDIFDFDSYPDFFRANSFITLAQAGTYTGPESMKEYIRFASSSSPYFAEFERGPSDGALKGIEENVCIFNHIELNTHTFDELVSKKSLSVDVVASGKIYYNAVENYIEKIYVYYEVGWLDFFFSKQLDTPQVHDFICETMSNECDFDVDISGACQKKLRELPTFTNGSYFDGDSQGCRALHGAFASVNPEGHCPHISFTPNQDPNGKIKCSESAGVKPTDLFDDDDIGMFQTFCEVNGIDPTKGYAEKGRKKKGKAFKRRIF
mmetsp:Transcript_34474/g.62000  ORF Transcript_34474/g.62000 Transcript_34474/m.62000 type:complete len:301 (-) Transcript_34474:208-1110(-)|eukprot:CAMPEP_0201911368 /NCGR_PEP_ID=MMETSP0903-20130614/2330_1 /ASSEMBLY_ACC=CAM_ASM_000552 /TAXON_ID=420261 /ORGANISM="Thalassiosira antarctica, Strain CCMP982" /LENGTH=300 /DNA_ID=CAMNT_0048446071 /DNA_START=204 /DNA_END=1106 /DNA_ORIENTATION=-